MTIKINQQLELLHDILEEHHSQAQATAHEYQQIRRLIDSIQTNQQLLHSQLSASLPQIYEYCTQGEAAQSQQSHIDANKENIDSWLKHIEQSNSSTIF
ncbi:YtzH-like family protein [Virgibacillus halophilus]|uniref:YtzH-like family protein n=1 Tax=Tigheibacillus halophilus TaxID=361280 RepID=A0ABU5CCH4_9BACI|nr:YtzH-like family protein [Virgibacillus halophilus]